MLRLAMLTALAALACAGASAQDRHRTYSPEFQACQAKGPRASTEVQGCFHAELERVELKLETYTAEARRVVKEEGSTADFDTALMTWSTYRDTYCAAVDDYWFGGTIHRTQVLDCRIDLAKARMRQLWLDFLTYPDSTPPRLPEP